MLAHILSKVGNFCIVLISVFLDMTTNFYNNGSYLRKNEAKNKLRLKQLNVVQICDNISMLFSSVHSLSAINVAITVLVTVIKITDKTKA